MRKKVIISAPAKNEDIAIVLGVNEGKYDNTIPPSTTLSRTRPAPPATNSLAPVAKVIQDNFKMQAARVISWYDNEWGCSLIANSTAVTT